MKAVLLLVWIFLDYLTKISVIGQTTMISTDNRTFPVCISSSCDSTGCGNPFGLPVPACSCDYGCEFFGDCCSDYTSYCKQSTLGNEPNRFEDETRLLDKSQVTCVTLPQENDHYWMVSSCPKSWKNELIKNRCEDYQPEMDLDFSIIPVSHAGFLSYKNVYCALCNGLNQNELTPWKLELLCSQSLTDMIESGDTSVPELLASGECTSSIQPPSDLSPSGARKCLASEVVDHCPVGSYQDVGEVCSSYQDFVSDEDGTTYRNPYCKLCRIFPGVSLAESQEHIRNICLDAAGTTTEPPGDRRPTKPTPRRGGWGRVTPTQSQNDTADRGILNPDVSALQPLSIIMDFSRDSRVQVVHSEKIIKEVDISCQPWEVFDPFLQECLTLSCADGYELLNNECHRLNPPLNITCGADDSDLKLIFSATIGTSQHTDSNDCDPNQLEGNVTQFLENALYLPPGTLRPLNESSDAADDDIRLMTDNEDSQGLSLLNNSLRMNYVIESRSLTFSQLEEFADRALYQYTTTPLKESYYHLWSLTISQKCISVSGLRRCPGGLRLLTDANVTRLGSYTVVRDEQTGNTYHSYETILTASYQRGIEATFSNYNKTFNIHICNQMNLLTCSLITQPADLFLPLNDSSLNNTLTGKILSSNDYTLTANGSVQYCAPESFGQNATFNETTVVGIFAYDETQVILSFVGVSLSLVSLLITFATYCIFPHMRRCVSNKLIMVLCVALFLAQLLQMISGLGTSIPELCTALSVLSHFLWTSVFAVTTCLAFELNRTLGARDSFTVSTNSTRAIVAYMLFTVLTASILVGCCLAIHFTVGEKLNFSYGNDDVCWIVNQAANLIAFGCPLGVFLILNTILFLHTVAGIRNSSKVRKSMLMESQSIKDTAKELRVYLKISTLLGFTWSFGFIAGFASISALWYVFIILNSLQGFYIFLAFIANRRVYSMWTECLCHCNTSGSLSRHSRGTSSIPFSQRMSRLTSVSSLPRTSEYDRRHAGEKGSQRYSAASQKAKNDRISSGGTCKDPVGDHAETEGDRGSPSGIRRYSHGEWKYIGERKQSGDQKYQTAKDWRNVNSGRSVKR